MQNRLAIVTQDPSHGGGVLRLVEYIYERAKAAGREPEILHYGSFGEHPELQASFLNALRGELNLRPATKKYFFHGTSARAFGAFLPEWEPERLRSNRLWHEALSEFSSAILITGSAQTGLTLAQNTIPYAAWISATVEDDRRERLAHDRSISSTLEKLSLPSILRAEKQVLDAAKNILAVSKATSIELQKVSSLPSEVWPFPIDTEKFSSAPEPSGTIRFLFVGRASDPRKRISLFLEACSILRAREPRLNFAVTIISQKINIALPVETEWMSGISEMELIQFYRRSTALVLTSEQEGLGIAAMEAMACGIPVISTHCGGPETFLEDGVSGFFADTPEVIAERMCVLATDSSQRNTMGHAARERIDRCFSEQIWNPKFESMLASL